MTLIEIKKLSHKNGIICLFFVFVLICLLKLITYFFFWLFLLDIKSGLYPYDDIGGSFYPYVVSVNALFFKIIVSWLSLFFSFLSSLICFLIFRQCNLSKFIKRIFLILLIVSILEILFSTCRFLQLRYVVSLTENCEFPIEIQEGCYVSPEKF